MKNNILRRFLNSFRTNYLEQKDQIVGKILNSQPFTGLTSDFPRYINLELTRRCNLNCVYCERPSTMDGNGDMDFSLFQRLIDEIAIHPVDGIFLNYSGEPLLYPHLEEALEYLKIKEITQYGFTTNGMIFNERVMRKILSESNGTISFSLDIDSKRIEEIRRGAKMDILFGNIHKVIEMKHHMNSPVKLRVNAVLSDSTINMMMLERFIEKWIGLVDAVVVTLCANDALRIVNKDNDFLPFPKLTNRIPCLDPFIYTAVLYNGQTNLCCNNIACKNLYPELSVADRSIKEVWNSQTYRDIRQAMNDSEYHRLPICRYCDVWIRHYLNFSMRSLLYTAVFNGYVFHLEKRRLHQLSRLLTSIRLRKLGDIQLSSDSIDTYNIG